MQRIIKCLPSGWMSEGQGEELERGGWFCLAKGLFILVALTTVVSVWCLEDMKAFPIDVQTKGKPGVLL